MIPATRRVRRLSLTGAAVLTLALGGLFLFLPRIVEALLIAGLERAAFPSPDLQVTDIGWRQTTLVDLHLGTEGEVSIDELVVSYSPLDLLRRRIDRIRLSGVRLAVRLDGEGPPLGSLDPPLTALGGGTESGTILAMPDIILDDGRIAITTRLGEVVIPLEGAVSTTPDGVMTGQFAIPPGAVGLSDVAARELAGSVRFAMTPERLSRVTARLDLADLALSNATIETATLAVDLDGDSGSAHLTLVEGDDALDLQAEAVIGDLYGTPTLSADVEATATAASLLWPLIGLPPPIERHASLSGGVSGRLSPASDRPAFTGNMEISAVADETTLNTTVTNVTITGALDALSGTAQVALTAGEVLLPDRQIAATGVEAGLLIGGPEAPSDAHLRIAEITHRAEPALFAPMPARVEVTLNGDLLTFKIQATAAGERAALTVSGQHDLQSGVGAAEVDLPSVTFAPDGLEPEDLAPALKGWIEQTTGRVALVGTLSWNAEGTASDLRMLLGDLSFTTPLAGIVRLNSVVRFDSLLPLSTPPGQKLAIGLIDAVLPLSDGIATFQLRRDGTLVVSDGRLRLAGGRITVESTVIDLNAPENRIDLLVTDAALSDLVALADIDGLSATGRLDGRIPVRIGEDVIIQDGMLTADAPGRLSYDPVSPPAALQAPGETISLLLSALTNFEYHDLRLTVDREAGGEMLVSVHVAGKNPAFYDGYPVELNFNISGKLDQVLQRSLVGYRIPDAIRERLSEFPE